MEEFYFWGVIFFKIFVVKIVADISLMIISAWLSAKAKIGIAESLREFLKND